MNQTFSISELAAEFAITTRAIRFYEDKGLLSPERNGNKRIYTRTDRTRLKLVLRGKRLGWPLDEVRQLIELYDAPGDGEQRQLQETVRRLRQTREQLLNQKQALLESLADIDKLEANCIAQLDQSQDQAGQSVTVVTFESDKHTNDGYGEDIQPSRASAP